MSPIEDKDKYVVYSGTEDDTAIFLLCNEDGIIRRTTMDPQEVPEGTEYLDHFWVKVRDEEIAELQFDQELTSQMSDEYQSTIETFKKMQEHDREKLDEK